MTRLLGALVACALVLGAAMWWLGTGDDGSGDVAELVARAPVDAPAVEPEVVDVAVVKTRAPERLVAPSSGEEAVARDDDAWLAQGARIVTVHGTVQDKHGPIEGVEVRVVNGLAGGFDTSGFHTSYGYHSVSSASPELASYGARSDAIGHGRYAPVSVATLVDLAPLRATTDDDGAFHARAPLGADAWLVLTHGGASFVKELDVERAVETPDGGLSLAVGVTGFTLSSGVRLSGAVVDEHDAPLEGVEVSVVVTPDICHRTTTDADGRYELDGVSPLVHHLRFVADGRPELWHEILSRTGAEKIKDADGVLEEIHVDTVRFVPTGTRGGRVLGPDGEPLAGAEVLATPDPVGSLEIHPGSMDFQADDDTILFELECDVAWPTRRALTDDDGRFTLEGLELDQTYSVYVRAVDLEPARRTDVAPDGDEELVFELTREERLFVDVVDSDGAPVVGASVRAWRLLRDRTGRPIEVRPRDGRFEVLGTGPRMTRLVVEAPGYAQALVDLEGRAGSVDGATTTVTLEPEVLLTAQVVDEGGEPVVVQGRAERPLHLGAYPDVGTYLWDGTTREVDDEGRAAWSGLGPGQYRVQLVSTSRYMPVSFPDAKVPATQTVTLTHERGAEHVVLVVRRTGTIEGRVLVDGDELGWQHVECIPVALPTVPADEQPEVVSISQPRKPRASFSAALLPGTWRVVVDGVDEGEHEVIAGVTTTVEVTRQAPFDVVVRVVGLDGEPWGGAHVRRYGAGRAPRASTDDAGRVSLALRNEGEVDLGVSMQRGKFVHRATFDVTRDTEVVEWVVPCGALTGRVHGFEGRGMVTVLSPSGTAVGSVSMQDDGTFEAHDVPPGDYVARVNGYFSGTTSMPAAFSIAAGRTTELELSVHPGARLEGSVWREGPDTVKAASVVAWRVESPAQVYVAGARRHAYDFGLLPPGRYRIAGFVENLTGALDVHPTPEQLDWLTLTMSHVPVTELGDEPVVLDLPDAPIDARP